MHNKVHSFDWSYLFTIEDAETPEYSAFARTFKSIVWIGFSIIMGMGVSQLT